MSEQKYHHVLLRDVASDIKDGIHGTHKRTESGIPFLSAKNVTSTGRILWNENDDFISENDYLAITSSFTPKQGDLLITVVGTLGRTTLFDGSRVAFQRSVAFVRPNSRIVSDYLLQASKDANFIRQMERRSNATAQAGLYLGELAKIQIPLPTLEHQRSIAKILSVIDRTIAKTEALIKKYQQIKAGLMHDLFTRGIGADGKLRPRREEAPELYRESAIGWIPKEWGIKYVGDLVVKIEQGWSPDCEAEMASHLEWGVLKTSAIQWDGFYRDANKRLPKYLNPKLQYKVSVDDLLITRAGPNSRVGVISIIREEPGNLMLSDKLYRLVLRKDDNPSYILLAFSSQNTQRYLEGFKTGLAESQTNISQSIVRQLLIVFPSKEEQNLIVQKESVIRLNLEKLKNELDKYKEMKSGLMHDLLTGKASVKVDPDAP